MRSSGEGGAILRPAWPSDLAADRPQSPDCLRVDAGTLVAVDELGREHRFPLGAGDEAPAALGVIVRGGLFQELIHRQGPPQFLAVLDRHGRLLAMDGRAELWPDEDLDRFASRAGLAYVPFGPATVRRAWNRRVVRLDTSARLVPYLLVAMVVVAIMLVVLGAGIGVPVWILTIGAFVLPLAGLFLVGPLVDACIRRIAARNTGGRPGR